ncbi:MAG: four helix bundle protein [Candidatus Scalindua sp.]|nr:four helix bundle protein [Candidatus Scalindua sp.]
MAVKEDVEKMRGLEAKKIGGWMVMVERKPIKHFRDLDVYQKAFKSAMKIFELTKDFPKCSLKIQIIDNPYIIG